MNDDRLQPKAHQVRICLRDRFALEALPLAWDRSFTKDFDEVARDTYDMADALLEARKPRDGK